MIKASKSRCSMVAALITIFVTQVEAYPKVKQQLVKDAWSAAYNHLKTYFAGCDKLGFEMSIPIKNKGEVVSTPTIKAFENSGDLKLTPMTWLTFADLEKEMRKDQTLYPPLTLVEGMTAPAHTGKQSAMNCVQDQIKKALERHKTLPELAAAMRQFVERANQCNDNAAD